MPRAASDTISLFSGIGGLDLGARAAGLRVAVATDHDEDALRILRAGLGTRTVGGPIEDLEPDDLLDRAGLKGDDVRYLIGGPPCTAFSHAGFWISEKRDGLDPAAGRIDDYLYFLKALEPEAFVLENVPGLAFKTHRHVLDRFVFCARRAGYSVSSRIVSAADFGVAQARRRLIVIGVRGGPRFDFDSLPVMPMRSASWAITSASTQAEADEKLRGRYAELLKLVPPGGNYLHFTAPRGWDPPEFKYRGRYWSFLLKLDPDAASPTLPAQRVTYNGPFHWKNRHLRLREIARLQSFPDSFALAEEVNDARRHLGNAVPPLMAAVVLWQLRVHLGDACRTEMPDFLTAASDPTATVEQVLSTLEGKSRTPVRKAA
ncbi:MAG TPA: DNA cytosine methyltransferase [Dehalococcoidia bacterium]|nr:DNA cytosine methyltransferase [Dehalococcoidia bacterium]